MYNAPFSAPHSVHNEVREGDITVSGNGFRCFIYPLFIFIKDNSPLDMSNAAVKVRIFQSADLRPALGAESRKQDRDHHIFVVYMAKKCFHVLVCGYV